MHGISFSKPRYKELEIRKPDIFDKILLDICFGMLDRCLFRNMSIFSGCLLQRHLALGVVKNLSI